MKISPQLAMVVCLLLPCTAVRGAFEMSLIGP
jgi:hypothetical protein